MNIQIINCQAGRDSFDTEGRTDVKTVPCITVVSCLEGAYDVVINGEPYTIRGGECFYTPEDAAQTIVHHICPDGRPMRAQWLYMAILVNGKYDLKKYYDIPYKLPPHTAERVNNYINVFIDNVFRQDLTGQIRRTYAEYGILNELIGCGRPAEFRYSKMLETVLRQR